MGSLAWWFGALEAPSSEALEPERVARSERPSRPVRIELRPPGSAPAQPAPAAAEAVAEARPTGESEAAPAAQGAAQLARSTPAVAGDARPTVAAGARSLSIRGRVTAAGLRPVDEARVELVVTDPLGRARALASAPCEADGTYAIELLDAAPSDTVTLCALAPGFEPTLRGGSPPKDGQPWKLDLPLCPGEPLTGRLFDNRGEAVAGAQVTLLVPDRRAASGDLWAVHTTPSFADGRFSLPRAASGEVYLHAAKEGVGTAWLGPDELGAQALGEVRLRGGPALAGVVRRPDGSPVEGLTLELTQRTTGKASRKRTAEVWLAERFTHERGDGLLAASTSTDDAGSFSVTGLRPGPYLVRARPGGPALVGGAVPCAPGTTDLELVCNARSLRLSVVDETGAALGDARILATAWGAGGDATATTIEATSRVGGVALDLPGTCERLGLFVSGAGRQPWSGEVVLTEGAHVREREAVLGPSQAPGRIAVAVRVPDGLPAAVYRVAVRPASVSRPLLQFVIDTALESESPDLAPGSYRLELIPRGGPGRVDHHLAQTDLGPVLVEAGKSVRLEVEARLGARIELAPPVQAREDPAALGLGPDRSPAEREAAFARLAPSHGARVEWTRADADPADWRPLTFTVRGPSWRARRAWLLWGLEHGTSELLEAGPIRLRIDLPESEPFETEVALEPGRSTSVTPKPSAD